MELTGNPFVDTGLRVLAALAGRNSVEDLGLEDIRIVVADGERLARDNQALVKCFMMAFGKNGPLTQYAYQKVGKGREIYLGIVRQLLSLALTDDGSGTRCDLTGIPTKLDFRAVCAKALRDAGQLIPEKQWLGRNWSPLGGSLGNDAGALPVASRPLHVSALALLALQYLPLGVFLFKGKLACPQSTQEELTQAWVNQVVEDNQNRLRLGQTEILGKGGGTSGALDRLMRCFEDVSYHPGVEAELWLFCNSEKSPDCQIESIPEPALKFIFEASALFGSEIRRLTATEPKGSRQQLFECIQGLRDYPGLYPHKKQAGASAGFYELYQREIRRASQAGLDTARKLAGQVLSEETKRQKEVRKPEFLRSSDGRTLIRKYIISRLSPAEYAALFPSGRHPVLTSSAGWDYLRYYLTSQREDRRPLTPIEETAMKTTHPKIVQIAETYRGLEPRKIKNILDRMAQRKIGVPWLQDKFCRMAEKHKDWDLGEWDEFACDEEGNVVVFELLFQIRLYLSNIYREITTNGKGEAA